MAFLESYENNKKIFTKPNTLNEKKDVFNKQFLFT
jgi:hypothetical protein